MAFKAMTPQVVQRALPLTTRAFVVGSPRANTQFKVQARKF